MAKKILTADAWGRRPISAKGRLHRSLLHHFRERESRPHSAWDPAGASPSPVWMCRAWSHSNFAGSAPLPYTPCRRGCKEIA